MICRVRTCPRVRLEHDRKRGEMGMEINKLQLLILSILEDMGATTPGTGMTIHEITAEVNKSDDEQFAEKTVKRRVLDLSKRGYVTCKLKNGNAKLHYITAKGKEIKGVLLRDE